MLNIDADEYDQIAKEIHSDSSPVGIDAKKTHILILKQLLLLHERLDQIQGQIDRLEQKVTELS